MQPDVRFLVVLFPIAFAGLWLGVTALIGVMSGWFRLQARYPDRDQIPIRRLRMQSGRLGRASYGNCLTLDACPGGLRVNVWRIFGLFQSPFFVPWEEIAVDDMRVLIFRYRRLTFGRDAAGTLVLRPATFRKLAEGTPLAARE